MGRLAIVIPAFKTMYFEQVLMSVAGQTCNDFTLYVGDDASPDFFEPMLEPYRSKINIVYKRFEENLGGSDLVAQWERCIDLIENEEWIWLFSDDDRMDAHCVERFYAALEEDQMHPENARFDLYHFNVREIDTSNKVVGRPFKFPKLLSVEEFLSLRLQGKIFSSAVEYVFRKTAFHHLDRFKNFDLGWGSDDATWIKLGKARGIRHIDHAQVYWRRSRLNISPNYSDSKIIERKVRAQIMFILWVEEQIQSGRIEVGTHAVKKQAETWFLRAMRSRMAYISTTSLHALLEAFYHKTFQSQAPADIMLRYRIYAKYNQIKTETKRMLQRMKSISIPQSFF